MIHVRQYDEDKDAMRAQELERQCEVGLSNTVSVYTDLLGDPLCRIRHSPCYIMLIAEWGKAEERKEMVGIIRATLKKVVCGSKAAHDKAEPSPLHALVAYVLGLRVAPTHRRRGIGQRLVQEIESWARENGAEYIYMATEKSNEASLRLFVDKQGYRMFRKPALLVHPVHAHSKRPNSNRTQTVILRLRPKQAASVYRRCMGRVDFFPDDIEHVLSNRLSLGTYVAFPRNTGPSSGNSSPSMAMLSLWNCSELFKLRLNGYPLTVRACAAFSRFLDRLLPWAGIPSVPDVFSSFGVCFIYGVYATGPAAPLLVRDLCRLSHDVGRLKGCGVVATEVGECDPVKQWIPHWDCFSCDEDIWCAKSLLDDCRGNEQRDWTRQPSQVRMFVDPREI